MALCKKKVKDINPCSPTWGAEFTTFVTCPPPLVKPTIPCVIQVYTVNISPAAPIPCSC